LSANPAKIAKENDDLINRSIELAKEFKAPYIRCFGFHGQFKVPPINQWNSWAIYQEWSSKIKEMKQKAISVNASFVCENEGGLDRSLEQMEKIGQDLVGPGFGLIYDMANVANRFGKKGVLNAEWLPRLSKYIPFIHAKGCYQGFLTRHTTWVNGEKDICNWPAVVQYFKDMDPKSWVFPNPNPLIMSIETHMSGKDRWNNSVKSLQNLIKLVRA
jgi:sugar phosphate isomerase/epimerase